MNYHDCRLCKEYNERKNILFETDNFFVAPALGQIGVEGYLLICSKEHYIGLGQLPKKLLNEFTLVQAKVKEVLSKYYTKPIFFEHGPTAPNKKGGCCIEHAHLHAVPADIDILADISKNFNPVKIKDFSALNEQFKRGIPYLYYENRGEDKYLFELHEPVPSQYLRQIIAVKINKKDKWNWMQHLGIDEFNRTLKKLKGRF